MKAEQKSFFAVGVLCKECRHLSQQKMSKENELFSTRKRYLIFSLL